MADHSRSVIDTARAIHEAVGSGSGDPLSDAEIRMLTDWLDARVESGWEPPHHSALAAYDDAVRAMARAAVADGRRDIARIRSVAEATSAPRCRCATVIRDGVKDILRRNPFCPEHGPQMGPR